MSRADVEAEITDAEGLLEAVEAGSFTEIMSVPIAVQEMVFALWLILKGFNPSALGSGAPETTSASAQTHRDRHDL